MCPDGQQLAQGGTTCINMNLVNVGKFLYNNTVVQDGLYKATVRSPGKPHMPEPERSVTAYSLRS